MNGRFKNRETFLLFDAFLSYAKRKANKKETNSQKNDKNKRKNSGDVNCGSTIAKCIITPKSKRKQAAKNKLTYVRKVFPLNRKVFTLNRLGEPVNEPAD